jgi:beta-lactam-binding protein with PASTA domain
MRLPRILLAAAAALISVAAVAAAPPANAEVAMAEGTRAAAGAACQPGETVQIPNLRYLRWTDARDLIQGMGLVYLHSGWGDGFRYVIAQAPSPGVRIPCGDAVHHYLGRGCFVPDVRSMRVDAAVDRLLAANLTADYEPVDFGNASKP